MEMREKNNVGASKKAVKKDRWYFVVTNKKSGANYYHSKPDCSILEKELNTNGPHAAMSLTIREMKERHLYVSACPSCTQKVE